MIRPCLIMLVVLTLLFTGTCPVISQQAVPNTNAVPSELLEGSTLMLKQYNCSISAPWQQAEWLEIASPDPKTRSFCCRNPDTGQLFMFMVDTNRQKPYSDADMKRYLGGVKKSMEEQGWKYEGSTYSNTNTPVSGAYSFSYTTVTPANERIVWHGYLVSSGSLYTIQGYSGDSTPSNDLLAFARSFAFLSPPVEVTADKAGVPSMMIRASSYISIFVMVLYCLVLFLIPNIGKQKDMSLHSGRSLANTVSVGAVVLLLLTHLSFQSFLIFRLSDVSAEDAGRLIGHAVAAFAFPMLIYLIVRSRKKRTISGSVTEK